MTFLAIVTLIIWLFICFPFFFFLVFVLICFTLFHFVVHVCSVTVVSESLQPHGLYPTKLLCLWKFSGKNTGVGCHFLFQGVLWYLVQLKKKDINEFKNLEHCPYLEVFFYICLLSCGLASRSKSHSLLWEAKLAWCYKTKNPIWR